MVTAFTTVLGLLIGSFLTVVADRVPRGKSIITPGSACGSCGLELGPLDLVPVVSWLVLRGKCRRCRTKIGIEPLVIEVANALLFLAFAIKFHLSWELAAFCTLAGGLVALSWIDLKTKRLPRAIIYVTATIGLPMLCVAALVRHEPRRMWMMALGAAIALTVMSIIYLASRGGMGDGDVRLSPLLGAYLGWLNPGFVGVGLFLGFLFGAVVGVTLVAVGTGGRKTAVPFGPFLALGTVVAIWAGQPLIDRLLHR